MRAKYSFFEFEGQLSKKKGASNLYYWLYILAKQNEVFETKLNLARICSHEDILFEDAKKLIRFLADQQFIEVKDLCDQFFVVIPKKIPQCEQRSFNAKLKKKLKLKDQNG